MQNRMLIAAMTLGGALLARAESVESRTPGHVETAPAWHPSEAVYTRLLDIPSHHGRYRASLVFDPVSETGGLTARVILVSRDGVPVRGARLALESSMPDVDTTAVTVIPVRTDRGDGSYRAHGLRFDREGLWTVRLTIAAAAGGDSLAFNLIR